MLGTIARGNVMRNAVKLRILTAPTGSLDSFDPGEHFSSLEFYETDLPITEEDRNGLAQITHLLAYLALRARSSRWDASAIPRDTSAYRALESHFGGLDGWQELTENEGAVGYRLLVGFLMPHYPPRLPAR
jgi:hypothetical protein